LYVYWELSGKEELDPELEIDELWSWFENKLHSERLKWNKEMREMIGEDESIAKFLPDNVRKYNATRNVFRHQLLEQLSIKKKK